ncbi:hypothetical protein JMJ56_23175 [Belnapia sp. T18]|uniref:PE family protein n=1 Tax=Belnapia arida TaxID=2804533 RepID=A0ABS1UAG8_9PROT|nr:hypothetical protein [Belnapia arida]MBL6080919.1 hypothetical protein [Belnapia arida]
MLAFAAGTGGGSGGGDAGFGVLAFAAGAGGGSGAGEAGDVGGIALAINARSVPAVSK